MIVFGTMPQEWCAGCIQTPSAKAVRLKFAVKHAALGCKVSVRTHAEQHIRRAQCWALANACPALCSLGKVLLTAERLHRALTCTRTTTFLCSSNVCVHMGSVFTVTQQQHQ
jgi:hypothetical protein